MALLRLRMFWKRRLFIGEGRGPALPGAGAAARPCGTGSRSGCSARRRESGESGRTGLLCCVFSHSQTCSTVSLPLHEGVSSPLLFARPQPVSRCRQSGEGVLCCAGAAVPPALWWLHPTASETCWAVVRSRVTVKELRTGWNADEDRGLMMEQILPGQLLIHVVQV